MTHEQFENEPVQVVRWMMEIHQIKQQVAAERKQRQQQHGGSS